MTRSQVPKNSGVIIIPGRVCRRWGRWRGPWPAASPSPRGRRRSGLSLPRPLPSGRPTRKGTPCRNTRFWHKINKKSYFINLDPYVYIYFSYCTSNKFSYTTWPRCRGPVRRRGRRWPYRSRRRRRAGKGTKTGSDPSPSVSWVKSER